ncbi:MAG: TIGR00730 family Rossman fold protein [Bacteroidales bacterium]|nr:TIGR00730 family Rossman fold protein [Bacteroidales bacterium]MBK9355855.1 TIGR00730 family Rossman fold protein [Bacteroidales bacterium]
MREIKSICVFCGSSPGSEPEYTAAARQLGRLLGRKRITLVYGGSNIGLMRAIADACLSEGGHVVGVMPQGLIDREVAYTELKEFHVVESMSIRKEKMAELSDAFIAMPGGIGTLDEIFEAMSWNQLEIMDKPVALLNTKGFYNQLVSFLEYTVDQRFVRPEHQKNLLVDESPELLLDAIENHVSLKVDSKWIDDLKAQTQSRM